MGENSTQSVEYELEMADSIKAMQFAWLSHQKVKRLASISEFLFRTGTELASLLLQIDDVVKNTRTGKEKEAVSAIKGILDANVTGARECFTSEKSKSEPLRKYLKEVLVKMANNEQPKQIVEGTDGKEQKTEPQPPQADIPCSLEKGTPVFHGHKEELVRNWLFVVENKMGTLKIPEKLKISCVIPFLKPPALTATINWVAKYGYEDWDGF